MSDIYDLSQNPRKLAASLDLAADDLRHGYRLDDLALTLLAARLYNNEDGGLTESAEHALNYLIANALHFDNFGDWDGDAGYVVEALELLADGLRD